jgi:hypothetical protein
MNEQKNPFDESLVSAYLDGELSDTERFDVEAAIQNSPSLQQLVRDLSTVRSIVAAACPAEKPARSFQSTEWTVPSSTDRVSLAEPPTNASLSKSDSASNRSRLSLGLLASLAAVVLILITSMLWIDRQPNSGQQIAMDSSAPRSFAPPEARAKSALSDRMEATAENLEEQSDLARSRHAAINAPELAMAPMVADTMLAPRVDEAAVPQLSSQAKDFLVYLEQKLNTAPTTQEANRWRFVTGDDPRSNIQADNSVHPQESLVEESEKSILVELGQSEDEIVLQVTEDNAKAILQLVDHDRDQLGDLVKKKELLAIAIPSIPEAAQPTDLKIEIDPSEGLSDLPKQKTWRIDFSPQLTGNLALAADENGAKKKELVGDVTPSAPMAAPSAGMAGPGAGMAGPGAGMARTGGGYGSIPNESSERSLSKASGAPVFSPKANAMRAPDRAETQSASLPTAPQLGAEQSTQTMQSLESTNMATDSINSRGANTESQGQEKLMRIRILIKKEPSSSGSNE